MMNETHSQNGQKCLSQTFEDLYAKLEQVTDEMIPPAQPSDDAPSTEADANTSTASDALSTETDANAGNDVN